MKRVWPPKTERTNASGSTSYGVDLRSVIPPGAVDTQGQPIARQRFFPDAEMRDAFWQQVRVQLLNEGSSAFDVPMEFRVRALHCQQQLWEWDEQATLEEATDFFIEHNLKRRSAPTIAELVPKLLVDCEKVGRRPASMTDLRQRHARIVAVFGDRRISDLTLEEVKDYCYAGCSPYSINHRIVKFSQLYNFAIANEWATKNLTHRIERAKIPHREPPTFTVEQVLRLLHVSDEYDMTVYYCLGLFALLRPAETRALSVSNVYLDERLIKLDAEITKTDEYSSVAISENLAAWLQTRLPRRGKCVNPLGFRDRFIAAAKAAGIEHWPRQVLRHSGVSYDAGLNGIIHASELARHNALTMTKKKYNSPKFKAESIRYWNIMPPKAQDIISFADKRDEICNSPATQISDKVINS